MDSFSKGCPAQETVNKQMKFLKRMQSLVLYHWPCPDGISAALAAHLNFKNVTKSSAVRFVPHTTYKPLEVNDLNLEGNETVYLLDFSGPPGLAAQVASSCKRLVILDHHKTAEAELKDLPASVENLELHFDMERSGATIALDYFKPPGLTDDQKLFFKYIEDSDLWRWALPESRAFYAGFIALRLNYDVNTNPDIFDQLLALTTAQVIARGKVELEHQRRCIDDAIASAVPVNIGGAAGQEKGWGQALAVCITADMARIRSEIGNALAAEAAQRGLRDVGVIAYHETGMEESALKISLRSVSDKFDTSEVSLAFGGGGHFNASSFLLDVEEFERWKV